MATPASPSLGTLAIMDVPSSSCTRTRQSAPRYWHVADDAGEPTTSPSAGLVLHDAQIARVGTECGSSTPEQLLRAFGAEHVGCADEAGDERCCRMVVDLARRADLLDAAVG